MKFLNKAEKESNRKQGATWRPVDAIVVSAIYWPEKLVNSTLTVYMEAIREGPGSGSVLIDFFNITKKPANVDLVETVDPEVFKHILNKYFL